jgi:hypothetical protein
MEVAEGFLFTGWALKWNKKTLLIAHKKHHAFMTMNIRTCSTGLRQ